jgi:Tfp pilus assembly protein PilF
VLEHLGEASSAQQAYRAAFNIKGDYEPALGGYALSLASKGSVSEADTFLTEKHTRYPNSARITTFLAEVKSLAGDHGTAQQLAQDALRLNPDRKEAVVLVARDHYRARKLELAKYALRAVLTGFGDASPARDPESAEGHLLQGLIDRDYGRRADALAHFESAVRKRSDLVEALLQLGSIKLEAGNAAEAQAPLERALRFAPTSPVAQLNVGDCYRLLGRVADAKRAFDQALALDSTLAIVHYNLGLLHLFAPSMPALSATEQVATAIAEFEKYKTMRGPKGNDDVDDLLSRAKGKQNELKAASGAAPAAAPAAATPPPAAAGAATPPKPKAP